MVKTKIAVLVSGGGTNLQALLDAQREGVLTDGEIVLVISSNDPDPGCPGRGSRCGVQPKGTGKPSGF